MSWQKPRSESNERWQSPRFLPANRSVELSEARIFEFESQAERRNEQSLERTTAYAPTDAETAIQNLELWISLVRDAEPLPNPRRGLFRWRDKFVRMPRRKTDGRVVLKTEDGEVIFKGQLDGPLDGSDRKLVDALNAKVLAVCPACEWVSSKQHSAQSTAT
jgi:hypothetical protein